jgi:hypothetical protein
MKAAYTYYGYNMGKLLAINPGSSSVFGVHTGCSQCIYG